ncbi:hypothetical protein [Marinobacterium aestuariivivens]|uniref:Solute-binding protein family 3/N-terminal domain-containing protein n=1 Tax=Marinobacterium aestuariivivens TaxID=1698799 RepID=A0ABW2A9T9_9GAMM
MRDGPWLTVPLFIYTESFVAGLIDAFADDDVALVPLAEEADLAIAFTHPSQNACGIAVKKGQSDWHARIDQALLQIKQNGDLEAIWKHWMPTLSYQF